MGVLLNEAMEMIHSLSCNIMTSQKSEEFDFSQQTNTFATLL